MALVGVELETLVFEPDYATIIEWSGILFGYKYRDNIYIHCRVQIKYFIDIV